jgi:prephenate dehydrogenase
MKITIIGLGLIGGSLAKACKVAYPACHIKGIDPDEAARKLLQEEGAVDIAYGELSVVAVAEAEIILISTAPNHWKAVADALRSLPLPATRLIMDVGSVKSYASECFGELLHFIPAHPIAGSEFSGAAFSTGELFLGKRVILTPKDKADAKDVRAAIDFWEQLATRPMLMECDLHDRIYAHVSHLPQFAAYAIARATLAQTHAPESYLKFLRLAGSSPTLWLGIFQHNPYLAGAGENLLQVIGHMLAELRTGILTAEMRPDLHTGITLIPRILASTLISAVTLEEKRMQTRMAVYAGSGFADMTHPAMTPPEKDLALISEHTNAVVELLDAVEASLREMLVTYKQKDWDALTQMMEGAQEAFLRQLERGEE